MKQKIIPYILFALFIAIIMFLFTVSIPLGVFFVAHWYGALALQSFFHHRYAAHGVVTMSPTMEKVFFVTAWIVQGSSFLNPRAYAIMHRMHHTYSDTHEDPHSPHFFRDIFGMMWKTKKIYLAILRNPTSSRFAAWDNGKPVWPWFEELGESWGSRIFWSISYIAFYVYFAPAGSAWWIYALLFGVAMPIHLLMNPFHGALVNWCGHSYGYRNRDNGDHSTNCLPWDIMLLGELFQNNHHADAKNPNFAQKKWEFDPLYPLIRLGALFKLYKMA